MTSDILHHGRVSAFLSQAALAASIVILGTFVYRVVQHALAPGARSGIPVERPNETRRVVHPAGFSIIRPEYWTAEIVTAPDGQGEIILWSPADTQPSARLSIVKLGANGDPSLPGKIKEIIFQGRPARMSLTHHKEVSLEFPAQLTAKLVFSRDDANWLFRYDLFLDRHSIPKAMWNYLETFSSRPQKNTPAPGDQPGDGLRKPNDAKAAEKHGPAAKSIPPRFDPSQILLRQAGVSHAPTDSRRRTADRGADRRSGHLSLPATSLRAERGSAAPGHNVRPKPRRS